MAAKKTAKKSATAAAKKAPAKKAPAKKATAKKTATKKTTAKKSTAKKSPAKKSTATKSTAKKASGTSGRRKRDGVVYTPDYIARFIVDRTLGAHARDIFDELLPAYAAKAASRDDEVIRWKSTAAEKAFWTAYRDRLAALRIVDPACGSGVFLVMAFDWLKSELTKCSLALEKLGVGALGEPECARVMAALDLATELGVLTAVPLILFSAAARSLTLTTLGMLQYTAPILQFLVAVTVLGEQMPAARWAGFGLIWLSLAVFTLDQLNASRLQRRPVRVRRGAHA